MKNYDVLIQRLDLFNNVKSEIDRILYEYEENIKDIIEDIKVKDNKDRIHTLFEIQNKLSIISYKYEYHMSEFLSDFIYEFDRQDEESVIYLHDEILKNKYFLSRR